MNVIKNFVNNLPFSRWVSKLIPNTKIALYANYGAIGLIIIVLGFLIGGIFGSSSEISNIKKTKLKMDPSITIEQAIKHMENGKNVKWSTWKDSKGRKIVSVAIEAKEPDSFFFPSLYFNENLYPSSSRNKEFDDTFGTMLYNIGISMQAVQASKEETIREFGISGEEAESIAKKFAESNLNGNRYFTFSKMTLVINFIIESNKPFKFNVGDSQLITEIKIPDEPKKFTFKIPTEGINALTMIYKDASVYDAPSSY